MLEDHLIYKITILLPLVAALLPWFAIFHFRIWRRVRGKEALTLSTLIPLFILSAFFLAMALNMYAREFVYVSDWHRIGWLAVILIEMVIIVSFQALVQDENADVLEG